uniref:Uncharacterized protein n=1 Tax=Timema cristinae TaxID=61476 RepID=A0A7R9DG30_TIMCR|nr:unnamed protein product [Timema cristinae]
MTRLMKKHSRRWTHNRKRLQAIASGVCGHYFYLFVVAKAPGWSLRRFTDLFSTTSLCKNNLLAVTLFKRHFSSCPRSSVQTQAAMEKVMCSCNMVEDHPPSVVKDQPEDS